MINFDKVGSSVSCSGNYKVKDPELDLMNKSRLAQYEQNLLRASYLYIKLKGKKDKRTGFFYFEMNRLIKLIDGMLDGSEN